MNPQLGKSLMVLGGVLLVAGLLVYLLPQRGWGLGRLPGDFRFERGNVRIYLPITTCLLLTGVLNLLLWLVRKFF